MTPGPTPVPTAPVGRLSAAAPFGQHSPDYNRRQVASSTQLSQGEKIRSFSVLSVT